MLAPFSFLKLSTPPFNPATLPFSTWFKSSSYSAMPWLGTASAGISGGYKKAHLGNDPTVSATLLNGIAGAEFSRSCETIDQTTASGAVAIETFVTNTAYTVSFLVDIMGAAVVGGSNYQGSALYSADAHWGWLISAAAQMAGQFQVTFSASGRTITRTTGSWITDGFSVGQQVYVRRTVSNDGWVAATLSAVTALVLTFNVGAVFTNETVLLGGNACISAGPFKLIVFNYTGSFPKVEYALQPGLRWIYVRRTGTGIIEACIDGVAQVPLSGGSTSAALADHSGTSGISGRTNSSYFTRMDFILWEHFTELVSQSGTDKTNYASYLNHTYATSY